MKAIIALDIPQTERNTYHRDNCALVAKADPATVFDTQTAEVVTSWGRVYYPVPCAKCKPEGKP